MSIFDKMFKKNAFDEKMDDAFDNIVQNNPVMRKAKATINEAANEITYSLERELNGENRQRHGKKSFLNGNEEAMMQEWDSMIDQIIDKELGAFKVCPSCGETAPAELERCPKCGAQLPEKPLSKEDIMGLE